MLSVVVLISGSGSNLRALLEAADNPLINFKIRAVGSDNAAEGLAHAELFGIPTFVVAPGSFDNREAWARMLLENIERYQPDLVVMAGFMRILPPEFVQALSPNLINTHPSLLPLFPGAHAVRDALSANVNETGVTVHIVDEGVDTGPHLAQASVPVNSEDSEAELHERIKTVERELIVEVVKAIADKSIDLHTPKGN
jgi:phosphoribosylglycinamide formyltransferase-1